MSEIDLADMSLEEQRQLFDKLAYNLRDKKFEASEAEAALWASIADVLRSVTGTTHGRPGLAGLEAFIAKNGRAQFGDCVEAMDELLLEALPPTARRITKQAVRHIVLRCLCEYMQARRIPLAPQTLIRQFPYLRHAVEQQYPGYIQARLLHRVATVAA